MRSEAKRAMWIAGAAAAGYMAYRSYRSWQRRIDFRNRIVVITGGTQGLGLVLARQLADEGAKLAICARDEGEVCRAAHELRGRGAVVLAHTCDLKQEDCIDEFFNSVARQFGEVDVLINNAGIIQVGPLEEMTTADFEEMMAVHFWASLHAIRRVLPNMRRRGEGRIVNISSIGGKLGVPHLVPYCASKFALVGLSQGLRAELEKDGVLVTTVCPGLMRTGSTHRAQFKGQHRAEHAWFSISGSLPLLSMSAERAASKILAACRRGQAELVLSLPAQFGVCMSTLAPELTADVMGLAARLLPEPGGIGKAVADGENSQSRWSPSWITTLSDQAARRNNEVESNGAKICDS